MNRRGRPLRRAVAGVAFAVGLSLGPMLLASAHASTGHPHGGETIKVDDPSSTRKAYLVVLGLTAVGLALVGFTVRYWRSSRPEPEALSRLETMSQRRWERSDYSDRKSRLDEARPFDATDGPMIWDAPDEPVEAWSAAGPGGVADEPETAGVAPGASPDASSDGSPEVSPAVSPQPVIDPGVLSLAELARTAPAAQPAPIADPEVLRALGLDDESLGIVASPASVAVPAASSSSSSSSAEPSADEPSPEPARRWWSRSSRIPVIEADDSGRIEVDEGAGPMMDPLFNDPGFVAAPVWHPEEELSEEEVHVREATGEFVRLVQMREHHDEPEPEQQRFVLPGEPLL